MSVKQLDAVFEKSRSEGAAFQVAIAMADWATDTGWCHPSYSQIQRKAHIKSRATVLSAIEKLVSLEELEVFPRGHAPKAAEDDDVPPPSARQFRNLYRLTIVKKPKGKVVQLLNQQTDGEVDQLLNQHQDGELVQLLNQLDQEVDQLLNEGGSVIDPRGSSILDAHIRSRPSVLTVNGPSAAAAAADDVEAFRCAWNDAIATDRTSPIPIVSEICSDTERRLIEAALGDRPLEQWPQIFTRVVESSFLSGQGQNGWVVNLWWLLREPSRVRKVLDGEYDDHFSESELQEASRQMFNTHGAAGCGHRPTCEDRRRCIRRYALMLRHRRAAS